MINCSGESVETFAQNVKERSGVGGERDLPGLALEKPNAQIPLQRADLVADRGRRDRKLGRRMLEAAMTGSGLKGSKRRHWWKSSHHTPSAEFSSSMGENLEFVELDPRCHNCWWLLAGAP